MVRAIPVKPGDVKGATGTYPEGEEESAVLKDGTALQLRPIRDTDEKGLLDLYDRLSSESLYFRFFAVPDKDAGKVAYLTHVDYQWRYALVAETPAGIVSVARWETLADRPGHAEVAFTVADDFQGRGLGGILFRRLAACARERGFSVFEAEVLKNNERMLRVFERTGLPTATRDGGHLLTILMALDPQAPPPA